MNEPCHGSTSGCLIKRGSNNGKCTVAYLGTRWYVGKGSGDLKSPVGQEQGPCSGHGGGRGGGSYPETDDILAFKMVFSLTYSIWIPLF